MTVDSPRGIAVGQKVRLTSDAEGRKAADEMNAALDALRDEGEAIKQDLSTHWDNNIRFVNGEQWEKARPGTLTTITLNNMLRIGVQQAALVSDTRPVYTIKAHQEQFNQIAGMIESAAQAVWSNRGHELLIPKASLNMDVFGKNFWKVMWRQELLRGLGDVSIEGVDPAEVLVDDADSLENCTFICHRQVKPLWWAKMVFPLIADQITPDDSVSSYFPVGRSAALMRLPRSRSLVTDTRSAVEKVIVEEWLIRDPTPIDEVKTEEGVSTGVGAEEGYHPKYPAGRLITRIGDTGKIIAQDMKYPWWDSWPGPWVEMSSPKIRGFWPIPPFNHLRVLQEALNLIFSLGMDQARNMSQGIWIVTEGAMRPEAIEQLKTMTAGVVTVKAGHHAERSQGPGINEGLLEYIRMLNQAMEFIAGLMDSSYGRQQAGVTAGAAIEALQSAGQAMIRLRSQEIQKALRDTGWRVAARIAQFYQEKRVLVMGAPDGNLLTKIFDPAKPDGITGEEILPWLTLQVQSTSELALSKEKSYALHAALYGMGAIDRKALLDAVEYPNRDEILKRIEAAEQLGVFKGAAGPTPRGRGVKIVEKMLP